jgi:hypothetical protein
MPLGARHWTIDVFIGIPTGAQVDQLLVSRVPRSVSIFMPADPASDGTAERIESRKLTVQAIVPAGSTTRRGRSASWSWTQPATA